MISYQKAKRKSLFETIFFRIPCNNRKATNEKRYEVEAFVFEVLGCAISRRNQVTGEKCAELLDHMLSFERTCEKLDLRG